MLPGPYERWFTELSGRASWVESRSTCESCAMLPEAPDLPPEGPFLPSTRCCTYHPQLAPHLVGGILDAGTEVGRAIVRARIAGRIGVSPLGLGPTPDFANRYQRIAGRPGGFGRSDEIRCPFYAGSCTIWQHRGAVCAAFHCKFDRGALGHGLWNLIVLAFNMIERQLARWLLARQGLDTTACDALLHAPGDAALDERAWGAWHGREEAYFLEAARLIDPLTWSEVVALGGRELAGLGPALRGAIERFDARETPERVRRSSEILYHPGKNGGARLQHRGVLLDLLEVPAEAAAQLARIDGDVGVADLELDGELLRKLLDWQVLVGA